MTPSRVIWDATHEVRGICKAGDLPLIYQPIFLVKEEFLKYSSGQRVFQKQKQIPEPSRFLERKLTFVFLLAASAVPGFLL